MAPSGRRWGHVAMTGDRPGRPRSRTLDYQWIIILWIIVAYCLQTFCQASWMYLGISSVSTSQIETNPCSEVPDLAPQQLDVCKTNPESLFCVSQGARQAIHECQNQFRFERWNCSTEKNHTVFGPLISKGTRETAFVYAMLSAGVVHSVTQACSVGNLSDCSCDTSRVGKNYNAEETWEWGGCSDNVEYGLSFSKQFVDASELKLSSQKPRKLMNLHNNKVGRMAVGRRMKTRCRCHGVSGSCGVKTCWRGLPSFREIGGFLKERYKHSVRVKMVGRSRERYRLRRKRKAERKIPISEDEMVYVSKSPSFCHPNSKRGVMGTQGRVCNRTSTGAESCNLLCCGRGYNTQSVRYVRRCHCKFHWCCRVDCQTCTNLVDVHTCK